MARTATKKGPNKKRTPTLSSTNQIRPHHPATVAAKKQSPASGHASNSKTRKKKLSHQQASQARDILDAEFRGLRAGVSCIEIALSPLPLSNSPSLPFTLEFNRRRQRIDACESLTLPCTELATASIRSGGADDDYDDNVYYWTIRSSSFRAVGSRFGGHSWRAMNPQLLFFRTHRTSTRRWIVPAVVFCYK
jgi:hypothetical protein